MCEIKVNEPKEEKNRIANITVKSIVRDSTEFFTARENDIKCMDKILRFVDVDGCEYVFFNVQYKISFGSK